MRKILKTLLEIITNKYLSVAITFGVIVNVFVKYHDKDFSSMTIFEIEWFIVLIALIVYFVYADYKMFNDGDE